VARDRRRRRHLAPTPTSPSTSFRLSQIATDQQKEDYQPSTSGLFFKNFLKVLRLRDLTNGAKDKTD